MYTKFGGRLEWLWLVGGAVYFIGAAMFFAGSFIRNRTVLGPTEETRMTVVYEYSCARYRATGGVCAETWQ